MYEQDSEQAGFEWIDCNDNQRSLVSLLRFGKDRQRQVVFICNFTPVPRHNYRVGIPSGGVWKEALNSDAPLYGGSGQGNFGTMQASPLPMHGRPYSLNITVPPLATVVFQKTNDGSTA